MRGTLDSPAWKPSRGAEECSTEKAAIAEAKVNAGAVEVRTLKWRLGGIVKEGLSRVVCGVKRRGLVDDVGNLADAAFIDSVLLGSTGMF